MSKDVKRFIGLFIAIVLFSLLVYPTPYKYLKVDVSSTGTLTIKHNWITGSTKYYSPKSGWITYDQLQETE